MAKGDRFPAEWRTFADPHTGVEIQQLTAYKGHSHHLYFTNSGWYDGGRRLLFGSDRGNRSNLFSIDLERGEITQLTDMDQPAPPAETSFLFASTNPRRAEVYFWQGRDLRALDLATLEERPLYRAPDGFLTNMTSVSADGRCVCTAVYEDLSARFAVDLLHGYVGFREYWQARPRSQIVRIDTERGGGEPVFEERAWIGHVNASPTLPHILTFCHEGPWDLVDQRVWGLDLASGRTWKIRPAGPGERLGHEYWLADGQRIGYHGRGADGLAFYGSIRYDNTAPLEAPFPADSHHFHSNSLDLIVGDGSAQAPHLLLCRFRDGRFEGPRLLLSHRGSFHTQILHVHPRFSPDGRQILFASDAGGYGNLHLIATPDFEALPPLPQDRAQG